MYIKWVKTNKQTNIILLLFTLQLFKNLCCYDQHDGLFMSNTGIKNVQVVCSAWLEHGSRETSDKISQVLTLSPCSYCWRSLYSLYCGLALTILSRGCTLSRISQFSSVSVLWASIPFPFEAILAENMLIKWKSCSTPFFDPSTTPTVLTYWQSWLGLQRGRKFPEISGNFRWKVKLGNFENIFKLETYGN